MKYTNYSASKLFRLFTVVFSKLVLCALTVFSMMLFVAVAEGEINLFIGLALGLLVLLAANVFCGILLPAESGAPRADTAQPQHRVVHQPAAVVPLRVVRGGRAA